MSALHVYMCVYILVASCREPACLKDIVSSLQRACGLRMPKTDEEWLQVPRTALDVRRSMVVVDGLREARKPRFDVTKLFNVRMSPES